MFSHLKKLIFETIGKRPSRPRGHMPRFCGQMEQLESRTVLSATIGMMAIDVEANSVTVIAIWESRPPTSEPMTFQTFNAWGDAPWESRSAHGYPAGLFWDAGGWGPATDAYGRLPLGLSGGGYVVDGGSANVAADFPKTPSAGNQNPTPHSLPQRIQAASADGAKNYLASSGPGPGPAASASRFLSKTPGAADYFSVQSSASSFDASASDSARTSLATQEAVFGTYARDSLLLAADEDPRTGSDLDYGLDDPLDSHRKESDADGKPADSLIDELVGKSLDALERERAAIDVVLSELHDVKLPAARDGHDADARSHQTFDAARDVDGRSFEAAEQTSAPPANDQADGGMVLLEPNGDANSSAYDLAGVYFSSLGNGTFSPLSVEASVGMYQAIDVGTSELQPTGRANLPIAQPATAVRPSVSAENAPAKKSEQPS
jgi:hypothetical protein